ncbi:MAG: TIGR01212 family radical SAM protein, partial [Oscillospiraceae bacterium]|nr:TIGR01212 family radical SAM protein [Oscillospiraceae bacterium]
GGCAFCSGRGSGDFCAPSFLSIPDQFARGREMMRRKWPAEMFIAYFQAHSNTYAPLNVLKQHYETALVQKGVVGLSISTRPDVLADDVVEYLHELDTRTHLTVELGLQTVHDATAAAMNRCHTYAEFCEGYEKLRGLRVGVHIINGLPGESRDMMLETARHVAVLRPHMVKIHLLHVLRDTPLAEMYAKGEFATLELEEYVGIVCDQLEILPAETVIGRLTGDGAPDQLIAPNWSLKKFVVMNEIDKEMRRR